MEELTLDVIIMITALLLSIVVSINHKKVQKQIDSLRLDLNNLHKPTKFKRGEVVHSSIMNSEFTFLDYKKNEKTGEWQALIYRKGSIFNINNPLQVFINTLSKPELV